MDLSVRTLKDQIWAYARFINEAPSVIPNIVPYGFKYEIDYLSMAFITRFTLSKDGCLIWNRTLFKRPPFYKQIILSKF